jgi:hypothetical protein
VNRNGRCCVVFWPPVMVAKPSRVRLALPPPSPSNPFSLQATRLRPRGTFNLHLRLTGPSASTVQ